MCIYIYISNRLIPKKQQFIVVIANITLHVCVCVCIYTHRHRQVDKI